MRAQCYAVLRAILSTAAADELIPSNPCRIRGAGQTQRVHKIRPATVAELDALTAAMPDRLKLAVPLASWCALRFGENDRITPRGRRPLRRSDQGAAGRGETRRRARRTHRRPPKTRAGVRDVSIPPHMLVLVEQHLADHVGPSAIRCCSRRCPVARTICRWRRCTGCGPSASDHVGRPDLRWHDLRHTGLVMAAVAGATLAELMARAGHTARSAQRCAISTRRSRGTARWRACCRSWPIRRNRLRDTAYHTLVS